VLVLWAAVVAGSLYWHWDSGQHQGACNDQVFGAAACAAQASDGWAYVVAGIGVWALGAVVGFVALQLAVVRR